MINAKQILILAIMLLASAVTCAKERIDVELDVIFGGVSVNPRRLYITGNNAADTLVAFDTLAFRRHNPISIFYSVPAGTKCYLSIIDHSGAHLLARPFRISDDRNAFTARIHRQVIRIACRNYLPVRKANSILSFAIFTAIYTALKTLLVVAATLIAALPGRIIPAVAVSSVFSACIPWALPLHLLWTLLTVMAAEYLLLAPACRRMIPWGKMAAVIAAVNVPACGLTAAAYTAWAFA
jgi:hypothetical protein